MGYPIVWTGLVYALGNVLSGIPAGRALCAVCTHLARRNEINSYFMLPATMPLDNVRWKTMKKMRQGSTPSSEAVL
jgi:hypothetical protein